MVSRYFIMADTNLFESPSVTKQCGASYPGTFDATLTLNVMSYPFHAIGIGWQVLSVEEAFEVECCTVRIIYLAVDDIDSFVIESLKHVSGGTHHPCRYDEHHIHTSARVFPANLDISTWSLHIFCRDMSENVTSYCRIFTILATKEKRN